MSDSEIIEDDDGEGAVVSERVQVRDVDDLLSHG